MTRKRMSADNRKKSIIEAAINVISRLNYDCATTALIAKEAGINEALIYSHFKSKKDLQLATLDYLLEYRIRKYASNPVFQSQNSDHSIVKALIDQYLQETQDPDVDMFDCLLKSLFAIDDEIREKGRDIIFTIHDFNRKNIIEDMHRGFLKTDINIDIIAWEMLGKILMVSILAVIGNLEKYGIDNFKESISYFEEAFFHKRLTIKKKTK